MINREYKGIGKGSIERWEGRRGEKGETGMGKGGKEYEIVGKFQVPVIQ